MDYVDICTMTVDAHYCINEDQHVAQMQYSSAKVRGRIQPGPDRENEKIAVVCYGPSLISEWEKLKSFKYIMTCSGAHKFLIDRGIIPTWHVEVDPRSHKADILGTPHPDVEYLIVSSAHKAVIDKLENFNTKLWHTYTKNDLSNLPNVYPKGEWVFIGGSTVGLRALILARFLGFHNIDVFGMDCSFLSEGSNQHASEHPNPGKHVICAVYPLESNKGYYTTPALVNSAKEFFVQLNLLCDVEVSVHGDGLLQAMIKNNFQAEELASPRNSAMIAMQAPITITDEYVKLNKQLHQTNQFYGTSGSKYVEDVNKVVDRLNTTNVLDYGCGKGTLGKSLSFPIQEYDPAIEGKDATPRPTDIVVCTDVLEHIEPDMLESVIGDLRRCMKKGGFFVINTGPAIKFLPDGRNAHLIQQNKQWWWKRLDQFFDIEEMIETGNEIKVWVYPKGLKPINDNPNKIEFQYNEIDGVKYVVVNDITKWRIHTLKKKEPVTFEWINSFTEKDVFVDVGANMGGYSLYAGVKKRSTVYAFEPECLNYSTINQNIFLNGVQNLVKAFPLSISDKVGAGVLNVYDFRAGSSCHQLNEAVNFKGNNASPFFTQGTFSVTLDYLVFTKMIQQPTKLKIDVDGFEPQVIKGAMRTLLSVSSMIVEVNKNLPEHVEMISTILKLGFKYDEKQVEQSTRQEGAFKGVAEFLFYR